MGRQILFIDDSAMLRRIAAGALGSQPGRYEVVGATRASEGFARACGGEIAVILLDERLAELDGAGPLCRRLLDEPRTSQLPVVMMTGRDADVSKLPPLSANVVEILHKPFVPEQLVGVVNTIVETAKRDGSFGAIRRALRPEGAHPPAGPLTDQPLPPDPVASPRHFAPDAEFGSKPGGTLIRSALRAVTVQGTTGVLRFRPAGGVPTEVFVDNGRLVLVTTRDGAAYSQGAADLLPAKVSPATLQDATVEQSHTGMPFLLTLGARGLVSKAVAVELLQRFGRRHFARLWTVPARSLQTAFEPLEALPGYTLRLEPMRETVDEWLLDTLRLLTCADIAADARHQGLVGTPRLSKRGEPVENTLEFSGAERACLQQIDGRRDLPTIARALGLTPEDAFLMIYRFRGLEFVDYLPAPLPYMVTPRTNLRRVLPLKR